jgi:hypothetical protein
MSFILYLILSQLIFISSRTIFKKWFQDKFKTKSEETFLMIIIQYILILILTYLFIFSLAYIFMDIDLFYFNPKYLFEFLNEF